MENWRTIPDWPGYEVSDHGRVRSTGGGGRQWLHSLIRQPQRINSGYLVVRLYCLNHAKSFLVHRLVTACFLGPCPEGMEVNHKNGDKEDNRLLNLEYVTRSQNLIHSGSYRGQRNGQAKITEAQVLAIRQLHREGKGYKRISKELEIPWGIVRSVVTRKTWAHVS